jgi:tetratricopeptide (TPR) repeat protein
MTTHRSAWLAATLVTLAAPFAASAAVQEIPITSNNADALLAFEAGQAAADRGDGPQANQLFRTAVAADPNFTYAWWNLSNVTFSTEEFNAALEAADQGAAQASEGERMLLEFNKLFLQNNFSAQLDLARRLVERYPNSPRALMVLQGAQAALNQFAEQRATLEKVQALDPRFAPAPFALGLSYLFNQPRDFAKSEQAFRRAVDASPGSDMYYWSLGDVARGSNRLEDARRYYKLALQLDPNDSTAPVKLGHVDSFLGNFDEARKDYDQGLKVADGPTAAFLAPFKAYTYVYQGEPKQAIQALQDLVAGIGTSGTGPDQRLNAKVAALTNAAQIALHYGLYDDAERALAQRAALARENAKTVGTTAFTNIQESQIAFWDAQLAAYRGDYKQAAELAKKNADLVAAENNPRKMEPVHEVLGLIELRRKSFRKAIAELKLADQTQLHNKYLLAQALEGAGRKDEAMAIYKDVSVNNFNTIDFALLRAEALKKVS